MTRSKFHLCGALITGIISLIPILNGCANRLTYEDPNGATIDVVGSGGAIRVSPNSPKPSSNSPGTADIDHSRADALASEVTTLLTQREGLRAEIAALALQKNSASEARDMANAAGRRSADLMNQQLTQLQQAKSAIDNQTVAAAAARDKALRALAEINVQAANQQSKVDGVTKELNEQQGALAALESELVQKRGNVKTAQDQLDSIRRQITTAQHDQTAIQRRSEPNGMEAKTAATKATSKPFVSAPAVSVTASAAPEMKRTPSTHPAAIVQAGTNPIRPNDVPAPSRSRKVTGTAISVGSGAALLCVGLLLYAVWRRIMRPVLVELDTSAGATSNVASHLLTPGESVTVGPGVKLIRSRWGSSVAAVSSGADLLHDSTTDDKDSVHIMPGVSFKAQPSDGPATTFTVLDIKKGAGVALA